MTTVDEELKTLYSKSETLKVRWPMYDEMIDWMVGLLTETIYAKEDANISEAMFNLSAIYL